MRSAPRPAPSADLTQASWPSREGLRRGSGSCGSGTPWPLSPARDFYRASGSGRLRPASPRQNTSTCTPPFRELIVAESVPLPPGAGHFAVGVTELRHSVGRAAAEPYERLDNLSSLLSPYVRMVLLVLFGYRISIAVSTAHIFLTKHRRRSRRSWTRTSSTGTRGGGRLS